MRIPKTYSKFLIRVGKNAYKVDRDKVLGMLFDVVNKMPHALRDQIKEMFLFGSFATGIPLPQSDLDLLVILKDSTAKEDIHRWLTRHVTYRKDILIGTEADFSKEFLERTRKTGIKLLK